MQDSIAGIAAASQETDPWIKDCFAGFAKGGSDPAPAALYFNFSGCAGIAERLLQSHAGEIELLPALPKAWASGSFTGLCARGGFEIALKWKDGKPIEAVIHSKAGGSCQVRYRDQIIKMKTEAGKTYPVPL